MFKSLLIITLILLNHVSIYAHVHKINNYKKSKKKCILYEYPNKKYCDYYPNRHLILSNSNTSLGIIINNYK